MRKYMRSLGFHGRAELFVRHWVGIEIDDLGELTETQAKHVLKEAAHYLRAILPTLQDRSPSS